MLVVLYNHFGGVYKLISFDSFGSYMGRPNHFFLSDDVMLVLLATLVCFLLLISYIIATFLSANVSMIHMQIATV